MNITEEPNASLPSGESRARTPAYANFDANTDKVLHMLHFILDGIQGFKSKLETTVMSEVMGIAKEIARAGRSQGDEANDQEALNSAEKRDDLKRLLDTLSDGLVKPFNQFTGGLLTAREWIPVLLVTTVEAYLEDVLIYTAKIDPAIIESSRPTVPYAKVLGAKSLKELKEELKEILPPRWASNFLNDGGPDSWIKKLTNMGARGYRSQAASEMETLWGVRHLIVHCAGVANREFVRRHPEIGAKVGESILIRSAQLKAWIEVVYHFVDVTDFYFVQRCGARRVSTT
jgi:hypothetical protein